MPTAILVGGNLSGMWVEVREHQATYSCYGPRRESVAIGPETSVMDVFVKQQVFILHTLTLMDAGEPKEFMVGINRELNENFAVPAAEIFELLLKEFHDVGGWLYGWGD